MIEEQYCRECFPPAGLPQGAVLSTTLFTLYIADIPHPPDTQLALYADDITILSQSQFRTRR